jgi:hypothetical protein
MNPERRTCRHRPPADIEEAYRHWRGSGSLRRTAQALGLPAGTVIGWCRTYDWVKRRRAEDDFDAELVQVHAIERLLQKRQDYLERLVYLAEHADRDAVKLNAIKHVLALLGIVPGLGGRSDPFR